MQNPNPPRVSVSGRGRERAEKRSLLLAMCRCLLYRAHISGGDRQHHRNRCSWRNYYNELLDIDIFSKT